MTDLGSYQKTTMMCLACIEKYPTSLKMVVFWNFLPN